MSMQAGSASQIRMAKMYASRKQMDVDFSGGLNNVADPSEIGANECSILTNFEPDGHGGLVSRPMMEVPPNTWLDGGTSFGYKALVTDILGYYNRSDGTVFTVYVVTDSEGGTSPTGTYLYNPILNTWLRIATFFASGCAQYQNRLYLCCQTQSGGWWGETITGSGSYTWHDLSAGTTPMPKGDQIVQYKDRLWIAGYGSSDESTKLYLSDITNTVGGDINNWPVLNFLFVGRGDGQRITKLWAGPNDLFILRSSSSYYFHYESDPTLGTLANISTTTGCEDKRSAAVYNNNLWSLSNGVLWQMISYQWYRRNDANKMRLDGGLSASWWVIQSAVSVLGDRIIVWNHGGYYCYYPVSQSWSMWTTLGLDNLPDPVIGVDPKPVDERHEPVYWLLAPNSNDSGQQFAWGLQGVPRGGLPTDWHPPQIAKLTDKPGPAPWPPGSPIQLPFGLSFEVQTRHTDFSSPDNYKVLYWWSIDAQIGRTDTFYTPYSSVQTISTWDNAFVTWDGATGAFDVTSTWDDPSGGTTNTIETRVDPTTAVPYRFVYRIPVGKSRFMRASFGLQTSITMNLTPGVLNQPIRLYRVTAYVDQREQIEDGVN